jgi:hypothetical protein
MRKLYRGLVDFLNEIDCMREADIADSNQVLPIAI